MIAAPSPSGIPAARLRVHRPMRLAYLIVAPLLAGVLIALLPSLALKLAAAVAIGGTGIALLMARRGMFLDPAWVIIAQLYVFPPVGTLLFEAEVGLSIVTASALAVVPFLLATLLVQPRARSRSLLLVPLVLLGLYAAASTLWSPEPAYGGEKVGIWAIGSLIPAAAVLVLSSAGRSTSWPLILIGAMAYALILIVTGSSFAEGGERSTVLAQNPIWAARAVLVGALVAVLGPFRLAVKVIATPTLVTAALLTLSLGPAIGLIAGILAAAVAHLVLSGRRTGRASRWWVPLGVASGLGIIVLLSGALDPILAPLVEDPNVTARSAYLDASLPLFLGSPLFGLGIGGFASTGLHLYPHNLAVEVVLELGIMGSLPLVAWVLMAIRGASSSPLLTGLVVGTGTFTLFSGSLTSQEEFWMFSAMAVALLPALRAERQAPSFRPDRGEPRDVGSQASALRHVGDVNRRGAASRAGP